MTAKSKVKILSISKRQEDSRTWVVKLSRDVMRVSPKDEMWLSDLDGRCDELEIYNRARAVLDTED